MDETIKSALIDAVIDAARTIRADLHLGEKYGGRVFMTNATATGTLMGGVYAYKDYVSVEFSNGAGFSDLHAQLEGKGKSRRHIKLRALSDIETKDVAGFLRQALA